MCRPSCLAPLCPSLPCQEQDCLTGASSLDTTAAPPQVHKGQAPQATCRSSSIQPGLFPRTVWHLQCGLDCVIPAAPLGCFSTYGWS